MRKYRGIPVNGVKEIRPDNSVGPIHFVYGWYAEVCDTHYIIPKDSCFGDASYGGSPSEEFFEVIPETVGQYTGLEDKNGEEKKDVYANDKIIITDGDFEAIGIVKMNDKTGQWVWMATEVEASAPTVYKGREIPLWEVLDKQHRWNGCLISHIHQNPELLENK